MVHVTQIAASIRSRRRAIGVRQIDLAKHAGVGWSTLRAFERGLMPGHSEALGRVLDALAELEADGRRFRHEHLAELTETYDAGVN
jgi:predicted transcriptional regulator